MQKDGKMRAALFQAAKQVLLMELHEYIHKERKQLPLTRLRSWHGTKKQMTGLQVYFMLHVNIILYYYAMRCTNKSTLVVTYTQ